MTSELPNHAIDAHKPDINAPEASNLSQAVFANPKDYLSTLQSVLPKANPRDPDNVTKDELIAYSKNGDNARDKAAAAIAANHFDQLRQLPTTFKDDYNIDGTTGLNRKEVGIDLDMATGNLQSQVNEYRQTELGKAAPWAAVSAISTGLAFVTAPVPPVAIGMGAEAGATAMPALHDVGKAFFAQQRAEEQSSTDRHILVPWSSRLNSGQLAKTRRSEINGEQHVAK